MPANEPDGRTPGAPAATEAGRWQFGPVHTPRASEILASRIRERILQGKQPDGTLLPSERELMEQTGLGRSTIREGLRILEAEGLLTCKVGPKGGYAIRRPSIETVIDSITAYLRGRGVSLETLFETRELVESAAAAQAAIRATEADLTELEAIGNRLDDPAASHAEFAAADSDWHGAVTRAAHNDVLTACATAVSSVTSLVSEGTHRGSTASLDELRRLAVNDHADVLEALHAHDAAAAQRHMRRHVQAHAKLVMDELLV